MNADECVFCQIAAGTLTSDTVAESDAFLAFRDIAPRAKVHALVIPREHHQDLDTFVRAGGSSTDMLRFVHEVACELGVEGRYRLITNVGSSAGQVVDHLHWHILSGEKLPGFGV